MIINDRFAHATRSAPKPQRSGRIKCISRHGFHDLAYVDWGRKTSAEKILCVHGLTRNGRDFDALASQLSKSARVVCPDLVGRGKSDWFDDASDYHLLQYNMDITVLAAKVGFEKFDWIGTSLGGLMGISLAGVNNSPIRRLVINDVGPTIPTSALHRISRYMGGAEFFQSLDEVEAHLRETLSPFGPMTDPDWARMAVHSSIETDQGLVMHHDPGIMQNFRRYSMFMHFSLWKYWDKITCPVLILRGTESDFLTESLLTRMLNRLPHAEAIEFEGVGHTPTLNAQNQIEPILEWLERTRPVAED
ncbi:alpha/beta fold hydrolase [Ruegeria lacuscaerulensis]|uniref:alpha/beta fold hydrolase n=1 Tax=Ruegeria lacuscaerulensis TaxID=55218 RepID=UPI00147B48AB|nr:alpha/beta hydrolase [Ruegeria lacuscaerulensis]